MDIPAHVNVPAICNKLVNQTKPRDIEFVEALIEHDFDYNMVYPLFGDLRNSEKYGLKRRTAKAVVEIAETLLAEQAPHAVMKIRELMVSNEPTPNASVKLEAAKTVLDRVGIGKKDTVQVEHTGGLFIIPAKAPVQIDED